MKILVTGGQGFIGHNLIQNLYRHFYVGEVEVLSVDNLSTGNKDNEWYFPKLTYKLFDVALENLDNLNFKPDVIFHLAATARIQPSFEYPSTVLHNNVQGTINVLEFARTNGNIPVIFAGSSSIHSGEYKNPYTFSKFVGEQTCTMYGTIYNLPVTVARFYNVYGPSMIDGSSQYATLLSILERKILNKEPIVITSDGEQRRDFTHVDDICEGLIKCVNNKKAYGRIFELGRGKNYSVNEVVKMYVKGDWPIEYVEERGGEARETLTDSRLARMLLNYKPFRNVEDYVEERRKELKIHV